MNIYNGFKIDLVPNQGSLYQIKPKSKGSVPKLLNGTFTTKRVAQETIDRYISQKGKVNAKDISTG